MHIIVDLVKRGVLTLIGEIRRYRNDRYLLLLLSLLLKRRTLAMRIYSQGLLLLGIIS